MEDDRASTIICDGDDCGRAMAVASPSRVVTLPPPWRTVTIPGWDETFHACSDACAASIRARYER